MKAINSYEIKESVEYKWRIKIILIYILVYVFGCIVFVPFSIVYCLQKKDFFESFIERSIFPAIFFSTTFLFFVLFHFIKTRHFLAVYSRYKLYEAILDHPHQSLCLGRSRYKSVYFTVFIKDEKGTIKANTNACFTSNPKSKYSVDRFFDKKVIGLYNEKKEKFYVVKIVD